MNRRLKPYKKQFDHTYSFGVFPTLELLGYRPEQMLRVLVSPKGERNEGMQKIREVCARHDIPVEVQGKVVARLAPAENCYAIGVLGKWECRLDDARDHVALVNPGDMGNLGTIIRTMVGFGVGDLAMVRPAADVLDPRVILSSMGAVGQVRFEYFDSFEDYRSGFPRAMYPFMVSPRAAPLRQVVFDRPCALIFGNESRGLGAEFADIGAAVTIPHSDRIDSLNLAVAVGIALHHAAAGDNGEGGRG